MGIYLNPGNMGFRESVSSEIYIDKSELIAFTNSRFWCFYPAMVVELKWDKSAEGAIQQIKQKNYGDFAYEL